MSTPIDRRQFVKTTAAAGVAATVPAARAGIGSRADDRDSGQRQSIDGTFFDEF